MFDSPGTVISILHFRLMALEWSLVDAKTDEQLRGLRGHTEEVLSVTFSPDDDQIVVRVWDTSYKDGRAVEGAAWTYRIGLFGRIFA